MPDFYRPILYPYLDIGVDCLHVYRLCCPASCDSGVKRVYPCGPANKFLRLSVVRRLCCPASCDAGVKWVVRPRLQVSTAVCRLCCPASCDAGVKRVYPFGSVNKFQRLSVVYRLCCPASCDAGVKRVYPCGPR